MKGQEKIRTPASTASCLGNDTLDYVLYEEQGRNVNCTESLKKISVKDDAAEHTASSHCHYYNSVVTPYSQVNDLKNIVSNRIDTDNRELQLTYVFSSVYGKQNRYTHIGTAEELHIPGLYNTSVLNENIVILNPKMRVF